MNQAVAKAEMLINAPCDVVFRAFTDKDTICRFWLESSSGDLAPGATVQWTFMVPGARETVEVLDFRRDEQIRFKWSDGSVVEMKFSSRAGSSTRASVVVSGLPDDDPTAQAVNATEGFAIVLCDLKSLLETGASGGMVRDKALLIASAP